MATVPNRGLLATRASSRLDLRAASACLAAASAGAFLYRLAFPPFDHSLVAWFSLVPLLLAVYGRSSATGFLFGATYGVASGFAVAASWFIQALARFFEIPSMVAALGLLTYCILFWGTAFGIFAACAARLLGSRRPVCGALAIAASWVATELLRGRIFQQPWVLLGYSQHAHLPLIQVAALTGVYGVSFLLALANAAVAEAIMRWNGPAATGSRLAPLAVTGVLAGVAWFGGALVLRQRLPAPSSAVAIVQANMSPAVHWTRAYTDQQVMEHARATDELVPDQDVALVVWPENAVPRYLETEPGIAAYLGALARRHGSDLLFGAPRFADGRSYNSVRLITAAGRNGDHYDKQRLVFIAERNPLRSATAEPDDNPSQFAAGDGPGVVRSFVPLGVSICHEILFPELASRAVSAGAALLVSVSNDGWLDPGTGVASQQHFAMAGFRAVETRRYLVRATTTGISGVYDPFGRVLGSLGVGERGALVIRVSGLEGLTPYARFGDVFAFACVLAAAASLFGRGARRARS
jgi:apolipoprotein N-acyltransferase